MNPTVSCLLEQYYHLGWPGSKAVEGDGGRPQLGVDKLTLEHSELETPMRDLDMVEMYTEQLKVIYI